MWGDESEYTVTERPRSNQSSIKRLTGCVAGAPTLLTAQSAPVLPSSSNGSLADEWTALLTNSRQFAVPKSTTTKSMKSYQTESTVVSRDTKLKPTTPEAPSWEVESWGSAKLPESKVSPQQRKQQMLKQQELVAANFRGVLDDPADRIHPLDMVEVEPESLDEIQREDLGFQDHLRREEELHKQEALRLTNVTNQMRAAKSRIELLLSNASCNASTLEDLVRTQTRQLFKMVKKNESTFLKGIDSTRRGDMDILKEIQDTLALVDLEDGSVEEAESSVESIESRLNALELVFGVATKFEAEGIEVLDHVVEKRRSVKSAALTFQGSGIAATLCKAADSFEAENDFKTARRTLMFAADNLKDVNAYRRLQNGSLATTPSAPASTVVPDVKLSTPVIYQKVATSELRPLDGGGTSLDTHIESNPSTASISAATIDSKFPSDLTPIFQCFRDFSECPNESYLISAKALIEESCVPIYGDPRALIKALKSACEEGDSFAHRLLSMCYRSGVGVGQDLAVAALYLLRASNLGDGEAMNELAICYQQGLGVPSDLDEALSWYKRGSRLQNGNCMNNLGCWYEKGIGGRSNAKKAMACFERAFNIGNIAACTNLGWCYLQGFGTSKNVGQAKQYFERAAKCGSTKAMNFVGYILENGLDGELSFEKAFAMYSKSAKKGDPKGLSSSAKCYLHGKGVDVSQVRHCYPYANYMLYRKTRRKLQGYFMPLR